MAFPGRKGEEKRGKKKKMQIFVSLNRNRSNLETTGSLFPVSFFKKQQCLTRLGGKRDVSSLSVSKKNSFVSYKHGDKDLLSVRLVYLVLYAAVSYAQLLLGKGCNEDVIFIMHDTVTSGVRHALLCAAVPSWENSPCALMLLDCAVEPNESFSSFKMSHIHCNIF